MKAMLAAADLLTERWRGMEGGTAIDVATELTLLTLNVLALTIFSDGIGGDPDEFCAAMNAYFGSIGRIGALDLLGVPDFVPRPGRARLRGTMAYFEKIIDEVIETRRRRLDRSGDTEAPDDLLTLLLRALDPSTGQPMSLVEVRSNILTFLSAGHETTANTLAWSVFLLSQSPDWRARLREEADRELTGASGAPYERLIVTRAVVDEALRLYPPIAALSRFSEGTDTLGPHHIRPRSLIVISPYVLHRHRRLWDRPDGSIPRVSLAVQRQASRAMPICLLAQGPEPASVLPSPFRKPPSFWRPWSNGSTCSSCPKPRCGRSRRSPCVQPRACRCGSLRGRAHSAAEPGPRRPGNCHESRFHRLW